MESDRCYVGAKVFELGENIHFRPNGKIKAPEKPPMYRYMGRRMAHFKLCSTTTSK